MLVEGYHVDGWRQHINNADWDDWSC